MEIEISKKAAKQIAKTGKEVSNAIYDYLESIDGKTFEEMQENGVFELKGNLKGLLKFKYKKFSDYRLLGAKNGEHIVVILCCEPRNSVYKKKSGIAKKNK